MILTTLLVFLLLLSLCLVHLVCLSVCLGSGIIVSHDRWFLDRIATHILSFEPNAEDPDRGEGKVSFFEGTFSEWDANRKKQVQLDKEKKKFKNIVLNP